MLNPISSLVKFKMNFTKTAFRWSHFTQCREGTISILTHGWRPLFKNGARGPILNGPKRLTYISAYMKVIHFKNRMLPFFFSQWSHEGRFLHIAIILPSHWLRPCFSIGWQRSLSAPSSVLILFTTKLLCYPITLTTAGGDEPDSQWRRPWPRGGAIH